MGHKLRAVLASAVLLLLMSAADCSPKGTECPSKGSIKVQDGQTYHCEKGPSGGLNWQ